VSHLVILGGFTHGFLHRDIPQQATAYHGSLLEVIEHGWGKRRTLP
jgi:hypothetical protein